MILLLNPDSKGILDIFQFHTVLSHDLIRNVFICSMCTGFFIMIKSKHGVLKKKITNSIMINCVIVMQNYKSPKLFDTNSKKRTKSILI